MQETGLNYIDGAWVEGGAGWVEVENPGTGEVIGRQALADAADVDRAVQAAGRVHRSGVLTDMRPVERGRMVQAMGRTLLDHIDTLAPELTAEQGKPLWEARMEIEGAARYFEYYGGQADTVEGRSIPLGGLFRLHPLRALRRVGADHPVELPA
jgi:aldehyde dehydrogenase (NAD+)